jgi:Protein of unknown function (DUF3309)
MGVPKKSSGRGVCPLHAAFPKVRASVARVPRRRQMTVTALLVLVLVLLLIGALPVYPYSRNWGYYPSGTLAILAAVVALILLA